MTVPCERNIIPRTVRKLRKDDKQATPLSGVHYFDGIRYPYVDGELHGVVLYPTGQFEVWKRNTLQFRTFDAVRPCVPVTDAAQDIEDELIRDRKKVYNEGWEAGVHYGKHSY